MYRPLTFYAILNLILCFIVAALARTCAEDRCLKRVQHLASSHPNHLHQCRQFFFLTYIPALTSSTQTVTNYRSTATSTRRFTRYVVESTSSTVIFPVYATATTTSRPLSRTTFEKRQGQGPTTISATTVPSDVRKFCTNTAAYSSACSCIGAKHSTITANGPTSTIYRTVSVRQIKTMTIYTTIATSTEYQAEYTTRVTYTTTTKTVTFATVAPTTCLQPQPTFQLRVYDNMAYDYDGVLIGQYAMAFTGETPFNPVPDYEKGRLVLVAPEDASNFTRAADCSLVSLAQGDTYGLLGNSFAPGNFLSFADPASLPADSRVKIGFASDSNDVYMEADTNGLVLNSVDCPFDYFYGSCQGVTIGTNNDYGYVLLEKVLQ